LVIEGNTGGGMNRHLIAPVGTFDEEETGGLLYYRTGGPGAGELAIAGLTEGDANRTPFQAGWWRRDLAIPVLIAVSCTCGVSTWRPSLDCFVQWLTMISALVLACLRIDGLRRTEAEMVRFQDENGEFKASNETLKLEVDGLIGKNAELKITNQDLQLNVTRLDEVRQVIQEHASKTQKDVGDILHDFHNSIGEQSRILEATRQIQQHTRRHADMEWRAVLMNKFYALSSDRSGVKCLQRSDFDKLLCMLPASIPKRSQEFSFENVDLDGKGFIDDKNMAAWVEQAAATIIDMDSERPAVETPRGKAELPAPKTQLPPLATRTAEAPRPAADCRRSRSSEAGSSTATGGESLSRSRESTTERLAPGKFDKERYSRTPTRRSRERSIGSCSTSGSPYSC
jgi:hypothetical protein